MYRAFEKAVLTSWGTLSALEDMPLKCAALILNALLSSSLDYCKPVLVRYYQQLISLNQANSMITLWNNISLALVCKITVVKGLLLQQLNNLFSSILTNFNYNSNQANELRELLDINGLTQKVNFPTHISGNCLDWMITRKCDSNFDLPAADFPCISDHHTVSCKLFISKPCPIKLKVKSRNLKHIDSKGLAKDITGINLPSTSVDDAVSCYNDKLRAILDEHAPQNEKTVIVRPNTS